MSIDIYNSSFSKVKDKENRHVSVQDLVWYCYDFSEGNYDGEELSNHFRNIGIDSVDPFIADMSNPPPFWNTNTFYDESIDDDQNFTLSPKFIRYHFLLSMWGGGVVEICWDDDGKFMGAGVQVMVEREENFLKSLFSATSRKNRVWRALTRPFQKSMPSRLITEKQPYEIRYPADTYPKIGKYSSYSCGTTVTSTFKEDSNTPLLIVRLHRHDFWEMKHEEGWLWI